MEGRFRIGACVVEPRLNRIITSRGAVQVAPKYMHVLVFLADARGDVVDRDALLDAVWPGVVVGDAVLTRSISELRRVLDDDSASPAYIETIRGRGYRLLKPVTAIPPGPPERRRLARHDGKKYLKSYLGLASLILLPLLIVFIVSLTRAASAPAPADPIPAQRARPLTSFTGLEVAPALSPDGARVAFARQNTPGHGWDLYIRSVDSEAMTRLTYSQADELNPAWSPGGETLAYVESAAESCRILTTPETGGTAHEWALCTPGTTPHPAWSPDGTTLAWSGRHASEAPLQLFALTDGAGAPRPLTSPPPSSLGDTHPAYSPDGGKIAFVRTRAFGIQDLFLLTPETGHVTRLTHDESKISGLAWTPDGSGILFSSKRGGTFGLWYIDRRGGTPAWANATYNNIHHPATAHQGVRRVYERWHVDANIWRFAISPGPAATEAPADGARIIASTQWDGQPAFAPDGRAIAFASDRSGAPEIWVADAEGTNLRRLTSFDGPYVGRPQWSPDGRALAFEARADGNADLYRIDLEDGVLQRLTTHAATDHAPRWSRDGAWLYFGSNRQQGWQIWKIARGEETPVQVTREGGSIAQESPDGQHLYYLKHNLPGLWRAPVSGGPETLIVEEITPTFGHSWTSTAQGVFFIRQAGGPFPAIAYHDFASGTSRDLHTPGLLLVDSGLSLSPNGAALLYVQVDRSESDLILEEPLTDTPYR